MPSLRPSGLPDQSHNGVVVNGLSSEGGVANNFADSEQFGWHFKGSSVLFVHNELYQCMLKIPVSVFSCPVAGGPGGKMYFTFYKM